MDADDVIQSQLIVTTRLSAAPKRKGTFAALQRNLTNARLAIHQGNMCWLRRVSLPQTISQRTAGYWADHIRRLPEPFYTNLFSRMHGGVRCCVYIGPTGGGGFSVSVEEDSVVVLEAHRFWDLPNGVVMHGQVRAKKRRKDQLLSARFLRNAFDLYPTLGLHTVNLTANYEGGGYVWAKYGFLPHSNGEWEKLADTVGARAQRLLPQLTRAEASSLMGQLSRSDRTALWDISDLNKRINGKKLGNLLLAGTTWKGTISLKDKRAMTRFNGYIGQKNLPPLSWTP